MKMKTLLTLVFAGCISYSAHARTSSDYSVSPDGIDAGGLRAVSADYSHDGSVGGIVGVSTSAVPVEMAKAGYIAQLFDVTNLLLTASSTNVPENAIVQFTALQQLDDGTFMAVATTSVAWSVFSGALTSVDTSGQGAAATVYEDSPASAQGLFEGLSNQVAIIVVNTNSDDYGTYAGDAIDDDWQVGFFGVGNTNAAPGLDVDGDGQDNFFEFIAGLDPTNSASFFLLQIALVPGQSTHKNIIFNPRFTNRAYVVKSTLDLSTSWTSLGTTTTNDLGNERTVTDVNATNGVKFYSVEISK